MSAIVYLEAIRRRRVVQTFVIVPLLITCLAAVASSQEVKYIDLTAVTQRTDIRRVPLVAPECPGGANCVAGASMSASVSDCGVDFRDPHALKTSITWTSEIEYIDGSSATWEMKIENVGSVPFDMPISPHLSDFQPQDPAEPFHYVVIGLVPVLYKPYGNAQFGHVLLYGIKERSETLLHLRPGEWIRVRAKTPVSLTSYNAAPRTVEGNIRADYSIQDVTSITRPDGSSVSSRNVCHRNEHTDGPEVHIRPKHATADRTGTSQQEPTKNKER